MPRYFRQGLSLFGCFHVCMIVSLTGFAVKTAKVFAHGDEGGGENPHVLEDEMAMEKAKGAPSFQLQAAPEVPMKSKKLLGEWGPVIPWPHVPVTAANLPDGRVLTFSSNRKDAFPVGPEFTHAAVWNPSNGSFRDVPNNFHDMFCSHNVTLVDGKIFVNGGRNEPRTVSIFDAVSNTWNRSDNMLKGRWYPTTLALGDGRVLTALGSGGGKNPEIWTPGKGWANLSGIDFSASTLSFKNHFEQNWTPFLMAAPDGSIAHFGPTPTWQRLGVKDGGSVLSAQDTNIGWFPKDAAFAMYEPGKLLVAGGSNSGENGTGVRNAMLVHINKSPFLIQSINPMNFARRFANSVVLPTGEVMVVGGSSAGLKFDDTGAILQSEIWNPQDTKWRVTSSMSVPRTYHSIALLLADGRVLSGGGGLCGGCAVNHSDVQVYSPGYLFDESGRRAVRPVITEAPSQCAAGDTITVKVSEEIQKFSLLRLSSVTHSNNTDQRATFVPFIKASDGQFRLSVPSNSNALIPGMYMLFAINGKGVPSESRIIQINSGGQDGDPTKVPTGSLLYEQWLNVPGSAAQDLFQAGVFERAPDKQIEINSFEAAMNTGDQFAARVRGFLIPTVSGSYKFWIASDDASELNLSSDASPLNKKRIAYVQEWVDPKQWDKVGSQESEPIMLEAGQRYYIEALHKEATGRDHLAVAWALPSETPTLIGSRHLSPVMLNELPKIDSPGPLSHERSQPVSRTFTAKDPQGAALVEWTAKNLPTGLVINRTSAVVSGFPTTNGVFETEIAVKNAHGLIGKTNFTWTITNSVEPRGTILDELWTNIPGRMVQDLKDSAKFPLNPDQRASLSSFVVAPSPLDNFGRLVRGYVYPPVTGVYTFWIASDNQGELYLSSDDTSQNKTLIASVAFWSGQTEFDRYPSQKSADITLQAGRRYYIEAVMKEGLGGDNLAVAWQYPGVNRDVIDGRYLSPVSLRHSPLIVGTILNQTHSAGSVVSLPVQVFDSDQYDLVFTSRGLPQGLKIDRSTGLISGTIMGVGRYEVQITVTNAFGTKADLNFVWEVGGPKAAEGTILAQYWPLPVAKAIGDLRGLGDFPDRPNAEEQLTSFEIPRSRGTQFGSYVRGYVLPPLTGTYTFAIASDDQSELWLSSSESAFRTQLIASVSAATEPGEWTRMPSQMSAPIQLEAGRRYLIEALHVQGIGPSHLAVAWKIPNGGNLETIGGAFLSPYRPPLNPQLVGSTIMFREKPPSVAGTLYKWNFGDGGDSGSFSTSHEASYRFLKPGRFVVTTTIQYPNGQVQTVTRVQTINTQPTTLPPSHSSPIIFEARSGGDRVWNVNPDGRSVSIVNAASLAKIAEITVGNHPAFLAKDPAGQGIWVTNKEDATVSVIDPGTLKVVQKVELPRGSRPSGVAFSPTGNFVFVVLEGSGALTQINPKTRAVVNTLKIGDNPRHVSVSGDGSKVFVTRYITRLQPGEAPGVAGFEGAELLTVSADNFTTYTTSRLSKSPRPDAQNAGRGIPNYLGPLLIAPDGKSGWIPSKQDNFERGVFRNGLPLTHDNSVRSVASLFNLDSMEESLANRLDFDNGGIAQNGAFDPRGSYLYVCLEGTREVAIVEPYSRSELGRITTGRAPQGAVVSPGGETLYVHNFMDRTVSAYDLTFMTGRDLMVFPQRSAVVMANEPLALDVLRGKQFFYDSRDPRLALEGYLSCAACHNEGGHDGRVWDITGFGEGLRNTISLVSHGGMAQGRLHWSGNFDEVQDFEGQIRQWALGLGLMANADFEKDSRRTTLGTPKKGVSPDLDALASYVTSLTPSAASPYRRPDGTLTDGGRRGQMVFQTSQCGSCHGGPHYTDSDQGKLSQIGTIKPSSGKRLLMPLTGLDTPTLRGLWMTAPYLHDGSALSLKESVKAHKGVNLDDQSLADLVEFLLQIE